MHAEYRRLSTAILYFILLYFPLSAALKWFRPSSGEIFPVFCWSLYSRVPNQYEDFAIKIEPIPGKADSSGEYLRDIPQVLPKGGTHRLKHLVNDLGRAIATGRSEEVALKRGVLEGVYMAGLSYSSYQVIRRRLDPLEYWRTGRVVEHSVLATFEAQTQQHVE